jgi:hypothetical protein
MITNADTKSLFLANLADVRISAISLFINTLISRKQFGGGIEQYRIKNTDTGDYITNLDDFALAVSDTKLTIGYYFHSDKLGGDRTHPMALTLDNLEVELNQLSGEDALYTVRYGLNAKRFMFLMNYLSDGDVDLPIKIFEVRLY